MRLKFPRRSTIAMGPALLAATLASGAHAGTLPSLPSLTHCGVTYVWGYFQSGAPILGTSFSQSFPSVSSVSVSNLSDPSIAWMECIAYSDSISGDDVLLIRYHTGDPPGLLPPTLGVVSLKWVVDLSSDVVITGMSSDFAGSWMDGSTPVVLGQVYSGASATFDWSNLSNVPGAIPDETYEFRISFAAAAVPLPGAAGLAACGLLASGRRRRR